MRNYTTKQQVLKLVEKHRLIAILRDDSKEDCITRGEAIIEAGVKVLEVSITTPCAFEIISQLRSVPNKDYIIGAGTILTLSDAKLAIDAGAEFLIAPNFSHDIAKFCNQIDTAYIAGVGTMTEIVTAMQSGCDMQKLFPANSIGLDFIKMSRAPLKNSKLIATGGVSPANMQSYMDAGCFAVAIGGALTHPNKNTCDKAQIIENAKQIIQTLRR